MAEREVELPIIGMNCANCSRAVERALSDGIPGVLSAAVNLATERASIRYDPQQTSPKAMADAVETAGYRVVLPSEDAAADRTYSYRFRIMPYTSQMGSFGSVARKIGTTLRQ